MATSKSLLALVVVAVVSVCACGKGSDDKVTQKSKSDDVRKVPLSPKSPLEDDLRQRSCAPGQVDDAGKCVTVVEQAALTALDAQLGKLDSADALLAKVDLLVAPITLLATLRELSAWKAAVASSKEFATIDTMVTTLESNVTQLKAAAATVKNSRQLLAELLDKLSEIHLGKGPEVALADLRSLASDKLSGAVVPLQGELTTLSSELGETSSAALVQIDKARALACAVIALGGDADLAELCKNGEAGIALARDFITEVESVSGELLVELVGVVDEHLIELVDDEVRKRLAAVRAGK